MRRLRTPSRGARFARLPSLAILAASAITVGVAVHGAGCQQSSVTVPVRSLERSGRVSFVCLGPPGVAGSAELPMESCSQQQFTAVNEFYYADDAGDIDAGSGMLPHLYALVTQTTRGEVAVIDVSSANSPVLDQNPIEPGANFLPVGAMPTSIVSSPGSVASFVTVAEIGRAGVFALPSAQIRPVSTTPEAGLGGGGYGGGFDPSVQQLSSWPACALPAAPGDMILINDPTVKGLERPSCDEDYLPIAPTDLLSSIEQRGRQKLVVAMPDLGGVAVMDAQKLLQRAPGSFDPCDVERWLPLEVDLTGLGGTQPLPTGPACVAPVLPTPPLKSSYKPRPGGLAYDGSTLYVADLAAPVVHVIDMPSPCEPVERVPLAPTSVENPARVVTTSRVAVTPAPTSDLRRYLYATDVEDGSIMMFEVGPNATSRRPVQRPHPEWNPFVPADRVRYGAPAVDLMVIQRDSPRTNPATGLAPAGVRCDPNPNVPTCTDTSTTCDLGRSYVTDRTTYTSGAGPAVLRGTFAMAALTNGRLAVIDIDDFDRDCRGPQQTTVAAGCAADSDTVLDTSAEVSCNIVQTNTPRAANYDVVNDNVGYHAPALVSDPQLFDPNGGIISFGPTAPQMLQPGDDGVATQAHSVGMNTEDPRAQVVDQDWTVSFEGPLPGFVDRFAELRAQPMCKGAGDCPAGQTCSAIHVCSTATPVGLWDSSSRFCDFGVQSGAAVKERYGADLARDDTEWARLADYVQIANPLLDETDAYWARLTQRFDGPIAGEPDVPLCILEDGTPSGRPMTYTDCFQEFGTNDTVRVGRDLRILEAYEDHVELARRPLPGQSLATADLAALSRVKCCFPSAVSFNVRAGGQWLVQGVLSGFLHHMVATPETGECRPSCDPSLERKEGRAFEAVNECFGVPEMKTQADCVTPGVWAAATSTCTNRPKATTKEACEKVGTWPSPPVPHLFLNPMFRFNLTAANGGATPSVTEPNRDNFLRFTTLGSFVPMQIALTVDPAQLIEPQGMSFLSPTGEVAITDGSINGLIMVSLSSVTFNRSFY
jgi:hypothetical protein